MTTKAPKILRRFKSDKKCIAALGSFSVPFRRKFDRSNPESFEPFRIDFVSMENKIGDELIKWCEITVDENLRIPSDIPGYIEGLEVDPETGKQIKYPVADMKVADFIPKLWEFRQGYIREDKDFHELSRLKFLEHENNINKEKIKKLEEENKTLSGKGVK